VPFAGTDASLRALLARLRGLRQGPDDEVLVADNRPSARREWRQGTTRVLPAPTYACPAHARNVAASAAKGEWLIFIDADSTPAPGLIDEYLNPRPSAEVGVLVGEIHDRAERDTRTARYVSGRRKMDQANALSHPYRPYGQTANCAVRRAAFEAVGGFLDTVRAGEDADLCWRLQAAGWLLESRPRAIVAHRNRERFPELMRQVVKHGGGLAWLDRRYPGSAPPPRLADLLGRLPHYVRRAREAGDREESVFSLFDAAALYARDCGRLRRNVVNRSRPPGRPTPARP
jgi:hypothetical protein